MTAHVVVSCPYKETRHQKIYQKMEELNMTKFTKKQYESLVAEGKKIMENLDEGQNVRDIMAQIYVDNLEDKTLAQGELMADSILQNVGDFDESYQAAQENLDRFLEDFQQKADEGKSCVERCNYWLKLAAAVTATQDALEEDADREDLLRKLEELSVSEEEATPDREAELRDAAADAIKNSHLLLSAIIEQNDLLEELDSAKDAAGILIDFCDHEIEYRAVVAMLAYTKIKNGTFEGLPADITAEQVTAIVCTAIEEAHILDEVGKGKMSVDVATVLLGVLGATLLVTLAVASGAIVVITGIAGVLLDVCAGIVVVFVLLGLFAEGIQALKFVGTVIAGLASKGAAAVTEFVRGTILPHLIEATRTVLKKLTALSSDDEKQTVEVAAE